MYVCGIGIYSILLLIMCPVQYLGLSPFVTDSGKAGLGGKGCRLLVGPTVAAADVLCICSMASSYEFADL